ARGGGGEQRGGAGVQPHLVRQGGLVGGIRAPVVCGCLRDGFGFPVATGQCLDLRVQGGGGLPGHLVERGTTCREDGRGQQPLDERCSHDPHVGGLVVEELTRHLGAH